MAEEVNTGIAPIIHPGQAALHIHVQPLIVLSVLVNLPGPMVEKLNATGVRYNTTSINQSVLLDLANTGTQLLYPSGYLNVLDYKGRVVQTLPLKLDTFLPQTAIHYPVYMQRTALTIGKTYTARLSLNYEHHHVLDYTATFQVLMPVKTNPVMNTIAHFVASPTSSASSLSGISLSRPQHCLCS